MVTQTPPTTAELKAAFNRASVLRFMGWTFAEAMAVSYMRTSMERSALAVRQRHHHPAQLRLI